MNQNDLDSFTLGLIKRTQERNKFLADMNLTVEEEKPETVVAPCSPLKEKPTEVVKKDTYRAEPVAVVDYLIKPQFSASSLPKPYERPTEDRKRVIQRFEPSDDASTKPSKLESLLSSPLAEKRKRLNERKVEHITESAKPKSTILPIVTSTHEKAKEKENVEKSKVPSQPVEKSKVPSQPVRNYKVDDSSDPCLLSLAARRALFERKMMGIPEPIPTPTPVETGFTGVNTAASSGISSCSSGSGIGVTSSLNSDVEDALAAFKEIDELSSNANVSTSEPEEIIEINNVPVENIICDDEDADESLGSNASSLLSNNDETAGGISQSTRIYPELPPLNELVHESFSNKESSSPSEQLCFLSPIKNCSFVRPVESPKKPEQSPIFAKPSFLPPAPTPVSSVEPVPPIRTLSMYRREQKVRTTIKKSDDDEDELAADLLCEAKKRELLKKYNEEKSKKIDELKIEADKYNKIIYQSFRALDLCVQTHNISERIEAEKILLINVIKKNACVDELYRLQQEESTDLTDDAVGNVIFNKLTLLVKGDFFVSQAHGHDSYDYHFICLFTCGDKVIATDALSSVDAIQEASLNFNNKTIFSNLKKDFNIRLEVYALALPKGKRNQEKKIGSMNIRLTPKSKSKVKYTHSPALKASPGNEKIKCNFKRIGFVNFTRENICKTRFEMANFMYTSPIEDQIMIDCVTTGQYNIRYKNHLNFQDQSGGWIRRWCVIDGPFIYFWRFPEDEGDKQPMGMINLRNCVNPSITKASTNICMRADSFLFVTLEKKDATLIPVKHLMAADSHKERNEWLEALNKVLQMIRLWEQDALQPLDQNALDRIMK